MTSFKTDNFYGNYINQPAYKFELKNFEGGDVSLADIDGDYVLMTFGFAKCTSVCPLNLQKFELISQKLASSDNLNFVFISFDDVRDDKDSVKELLDLFNIKKIIGLTSGKDSGLDVANKFFNNLTLDKVKLKRDSDFQINHNGFIYLLDRFGNLVLVYTQKNLEIEKVVADINKIIKKDG